jgi:predicted nuclease with RNAse H fold
MTGLFVGIDVGAERLDCVALTGRLQVHETVVFSADEIPRLAAWAGGASAVAIDAPARLSTAPHRADHSLSPKFALARCAEIALGRDYRIWVPWVTPMAEPVPGWMATGLAVHEVLRRPGLEPIEVFPYAAYRRLVPRARLPKKQTTEGVRVRVDALRRAGIDSESLLIWPHDALDALVAALIAHDHDDGKAIAATCGHDGSVIWLPAER